MIGIFFTLACSVVAAFYFICNDFFSIRGDVFVFWRSVLATMMMLPLVPFLNWDYEPAFFLLAAGAALFAAAGDMLTFNASRVYSSSAIARVSQFRNVILFCLWPLIVTGYWDRLSSNLYILFGSFFLIVATAVVMFKMRKNAVGMKVIFASLPIIFCIGVSDIFFTLGIGQTSSWNMMIVIAIVFSSVMSVASGGWLLGYRAIGRPVDIFHGKWLKAGIINGALFIGVVVLKGFALSYLENPGLFGAMLAVYTLWLYLLHKYWMKREDHSDPRLGFVLVICSIALGILSAYIPK
ncbi:MAG: hypothetical protein PHX61_03755 [Alphaproteobacteria bacterium]|nr:hypothetical protein [Alphaproteobacteria bacterium]